MVEKGGATKVGGAASKRNDVRAYKDKSKPDDIRTSNIIAAKGKIID